MSTSDDLRKLVTEARPLIEQSLDLSDQLAALRDVATNQGIDWSQVKALLKAQIQDERDDDSDGKRVARIVEKADFAASYADMLGLTNMNENNFSVTPTPPAVPLEREQLRPRNELQTLPPVPASSHLEMPDIPPFLDRRPSA